MKAVSKRQIAAGLATMSVMYVNVNAVSKSFLKRILSKHQTLIKKFDISCFAYFNSLSIFNQPFAIAKKSNVIYDLHMRQTACLV